MILRTRRSLARLVLPASLVLAVLLIGNFDAFAYNVCELAPPKRVKTCLVHFAEGEVEVKPGSLAAREVEACVKQLGYLDDLALIGHADSCQMDLATALRTTGAKVVTSQDTGNSLLGEKRIDSVATAIRGAYTVAGVRGAITFWTENRSDEDSRGHDADDRSVELRPRVAPGCPKNPSYTYLVDGSSSMEGFWPAIAGLGFPADSCIYLVTDGNCPGSLREYRPYGSTSIVTEAANFIRRGRAKGLVVLTDYDQPSARADDDKLVRQTARDKSSGMTIVVY